MFFSSDNEYGYFRATTVLPATAIFVVQGMHIISSAPYPRKLKEEDSANCARNPCRKFFRWRRRVCQCHLYPVVDALFTSRLTTGHVEALTLWRKYRVCIGNVFTPAQSRRPNEEMKYRPHSRFYTGIK